MFGFGSWKHIDVDIDGDEVTVIRIPYFGVDSRYKGERDATGESLAVRLYATIEARAANNPASAPGTPVELYCVESNDRGLAFWRKCGFRDIGPVYFKDVQYRRMMKRLSGLPAG